MTQVIYERLGLVSDGTDPTPYKMEGRTYILGEGSTSVMLESEASANARNAEKYAEVAGYGMIHESVAVGTLRGSGEALDKAIKAACESAGITLNDIDAIIGFGNGNSTIDKIEMDSYERVFGDNMKPVLSVKTLVGESRAAAATLAVAHGSLMLAGKLPATLPAFNFVNGAAESTTVDTTDYKYVLTTSYAAGGSYTAVVLKKVN